MKLFSKIIATEEEKLKYSKLFIQLLSDEVTANGVHLEKLSGTANEILSARDTLKSRVIFSKDKQEQGTLVLLQELRDHEYDKSPFLHDKNALPLYLNNLPNDLRQGSKKIYTMQDLAPVILENKPTTSFLLNEDDFKENLSSNSFFNLELDDFQKQAITINPPMIIVGPAGSGKTLTAIAFLRHMLNSYKIGKAIYIAKSPALIKKIQFEWGQFDGNELYKNSIDFLTYQELLQQSYPEIKFIPDDEEFIEFSKWFNNLPKNKKNNLFKMSTYQIYDEIKILSGHTETDYRRLGRKESSVSEEHRELIIENYNNLISYLNSQNLAMPSFFKINKKLGYDFAVVDEAQDFSQLALHNQLTFLAQDGVLDLKNTNFIGFFGDDRQTIDDTIPKIPYLIKMLGKDRLIELKNIYRCPKSIIDLANFVEILGKKYKGKKNFKNIDDTEINCTKEEEGIINWVEEIPKKIKDLSAHTAIIIADEQFRKEAENVFNKHPLILTPKQIKGLEYPKIIYFKPFDSQAILDAIKYKKQNDDGDPKYGKEFHKIFVGFTRTQNELTIIQTNNYKNEIAQEVFNKAKTLNGFINSITEVSENEQETFSTDKDWIEEVIKMVNNDNYIIAFNILKNKLKYTPVNAFKTLIDNPYSVSKPVLIRALRGNIHQQTLKDIINLIDKQEQSLKKIAEKQLEDLIKQILNDKKLFASEDPSSLLAKHQDLLKNINLDILFTNIVPDENIPMIMIFAKNNLWHIVNQLIDMRLDINLNCQDKNEATLLYLAAFNQQWELVEKLLIHGANNYLIIPKVISGTKQDNSSFKNILFLALTADKLKSIAKTINNIYIPDALLETTFDYDNNGKKYHLLSYNAKKDSHSIAKVYAYFACCSQLLDLKKQQLLAQSIDCAIESSSEYALQFILKNYSNACNTYLTIDGKNMFLELLKKHISNLISQYIQNDEIPNEKLQFKIIHMLVFKLLDHYDHKRDKLHDMIIHVLNSGFFSLFHHIFIGCSKNEDNYSFYLPYEIAKIIKTYFQQEVEKLKSPQSGSFLCHSEFLKHPPEKVFPLLALMYYYIRTLMIIFNKQLYNNVSEKKINSKKKILVDENILHCFAVIFDYTPPNDELGQYTKDKQNIICTIAKLLSISSHTHLEKLMLFYIHELFFDMNDKNYINGFLNNDQAKETTITCIKTVLISGNKEVKTNSYFFSLFLEWLSYIYRKNKQKYCNIKNLYDTLQNIHAKEKIKLAPLNINFVSSSLLAELPKLYLDASTKNKIKILELTAYLLNTNYDQYCKNYISHNFVYDHFQNFLFYAIFIHKLPDRKVDDCFIQSLPNKKINNITVRQFFLNTCIEHSLINYTTSWYFTFPTLLTIPYHLKKISEPNVENKQRFLNYITNPNEVEKIKTILFDLFSNGDAYYKLQGSYNKSQIILITYHLLDFFSQCDEYNNFFQTELFKHEKAQSFLIDVCFVEELPQPIDIENQTIRQLFTDICMKLSLITHQSPYKTFMPTFLGIAIYLKTQTEKERFLNYLSNPYEFNKIKNTILSDFDQVNSRAKYSPQLVKNLILKASGKLKDVNTFQECVNYHSLINLLEEQMSMISKEEVNSIPQLAQYKIHSNNQIPLSEEVENRNHSTPKRVTPKKTVAKKNRKKHKNK